MGRSGGADLAPLRIPAFRWLTAGGTISRLGSGMAPIALAFGVLDLDGSAVELGLVVAARSIANIAFLLFGGALADRLPRSVLLTGSSVASAVTQAAVAVVIGARVDALWLLIALAAVNGAVSAIGQPVVTALVRESVPGELLTSANALHRLGVNTAGVIGTALAGIVVAFAGSAAGIAVDAATFAVAALCFARLRTAAPTRETRTSIWRDIADGWSAFASRTWLWAVVAAFTVLNAVWAGTADVLAPVVADASFGRAALGFVFAANTAGFLVGGLVALRLRPRRPLLVGLLVTLPIAAAPLLLVGPSPVWLLLPAFFVLGIGVELFEVLWQTALQTHIDASLLARVASIDMVGSFVAIPIGQLAAGPAAHAIGLPQALLLGAVLGVVGVAGCIAVPQVRRLRGVGSPD